MQGEVEFLIDSNSKVTTAEIIKNFQKKMYPLAPNRIQQTIIPAPKYKYIITLKKTPKSDMSNTFSQMFLRQQIKKELASDQVFFKANSIEIWSNKEVDLADLKKNELLTLKKSAPYGSGIQSVKLLGKQ